MSLQGHKKTKRVKRFKYSKTLMPYQIRSIDMICEIVNKYNGNELFTKSHLALTLGEYYNAMALNMPIDIADLLYAYGYNHMKAVSDTDRETVARFERKIVDLYEELEPLFDKASTLQGGIKADITYSRLEFYEN